MQKSEIRKDYFLEKYVIITPTRAKRPRDIKEQTVINRDGTCYFCPEKIDWNNVIDFMGSKNNWEVLAINNIFPAVTLNNKKAYGKQEVIIDTPSHTADLGDLPTKEIEKVLKMYSRRTIALSKNKNIDYILCFKNQGSKAGASMVHAHSQIFATAILPPDIKKELEVAKDYKNSKGRCVHCDIIKKEMKGKRKIYSDKHVSAFAPYASAFHYEAWITTKRHVDNITGLNEQEIKSMAKILKKILTKLKSINLSFNYSLHQVVSNTDQHLTIKIEPRDSIWAGVELNSGLIINSVPPEEAARFYRK